MYKQILNSLVAKLVFIVYFLLVIFWFYIRISGLQEGSVNNLFGTLYPIISLVGAIYGLLVVSKKWGGVNSIVGRGIFFLSLGLIGQVFGQWAWSYYTIIQGIEVPYPSIADIGYFSIIPFYGYAMYNFAKASGVKVNLRNFFGKLQTILIPVFMIGVAYFLFLRNVEVDLSNWLKTFLDFGYPGFEAIAVSFGILTISLSQGVLGGKMRSKVLFLVVALLAQYVTDYTFLYQVGVGTYYNAGIVDLMYATSALLMTLGILSFNSGVTDEIRA